VAETADRRLTKVSFRRDVRIFLTALGCFFAVLVAVLLLLLQQTMREARSAREQQWSTVANAAAGEIATAVATGQSSNIGIILTAVRARHPITAAEAVLTNGARFRSGGLADDGPAVERREPWGMLRLVVDDSSLQSLNRNIRIVTGITAVATAGGLLLLLLYIPRIVRPIEALLDQAAQIEERPESVDEQSYLLDTFRKTVATLKQQQDELRVLHDQQKSRADELARVTSALTRGMTSGLLAIDPEGTIIEINQAGREILRLPSMPQDSGSIEAILGTTSFASIVREAVERRAPFTRRETTATTPEGDVLSIGVTTVPLRDETDAFFGLLVLFTDLTAIRILETRLRDSQILADLGEMSAGIAHELRNSLSTILGYLKLAQRQPMPEETAAKVRAAEEEAVQLSEAVASLLSFARPMPIQPQELDLRALIDSVIRRLRTSAGGVRMTVEGDSVIQGDPAMLSRAFENVIRNAVESARARHADGNGSVAVTIDGGAIVVRDNGVGLDPETASRLFLPFQSNKPGGFGLGLALTKKIVLLHGGTISLTGMPGEGATVEMRFA
jgi:signal transduction histidine kinase